MAAITITERPPKHKTRVCFSIAAYSKNLIAHLHRHSNVPIDHGLTQTELSSIESSFNFSFPPDLRSILREGLPVGQGFPNWRSSSPQQLHILISLPILGLCKEVYRQKFWHCSWGDRPEEDDEAVELAKSFLKDYPVLVPVYRNYYIPARPCLTGNPIFYVNGLDVRLWSYDVVGFFQQTEFKERLMRPSMRLTGHVLSAPAWAATEARVIEFWTGLTEVRRGEMEKRWWSGKGLGRCLEDMRLKLRDGGWKEDDVDEMMMIRMGMNGGGSSSSSSPSPSLSSSLSCSSSDDDGGGAVEGRGGREGVGVVGWHVMVLSERLLRGGWSKGDVVESLGCLSLTVDHEEDGDRTVDIENGGGGDSLFDFKDISDSCVGDGQSASSRPVQTTKNATI